MIIVLSSTVREESLVETLENGEQNSQKFRKVIILNRVMCGLLHLLLHLKVHYIITFPTVATNTACSLYFTCFRVTTRSTLQPKHGSNWEWGQ